MAKEMIEDLPETVHTFQLDVDGNVTKKRFLGEFTCKIPSIKDQAMIAKYEAALNGEFPVYLNAGVLKVHKQIAYLKFTLTDVPRFWRDSEGGYALRDPNVIEAVYNEVLAFEDKWMEQIWGAADDGSTEQEES